VYVLFGKVVLVLDQPGLHLLWLKLGWKAPLVNWIGRCHVLDLRLDQEYLRSQPVNSEEGAPMGLGIWYEMFISEPVAYLFKNADPRGSLAANVSNAVVRSLSNMPLDQMLVNRHGMSRTVREEVSPRSHEWGYKLGSVYIRKVHFRDQDIEYLKSQTDRKGNRIFKDDFLDWLRANGDFSGINIRAIPEGRVIHPGEPVTVVQGPLLKAQLLETALLNHLNYQILIATKASRIHESGRGQMMMEFGLRRGQGLGANAGARAAMIGGADFTSNVGVSHVLGYPPKGTHAHSMVQAFMALGQGELEAFRAYAEVYPDDCMLLVDTINTLESGVPNAIRVFEELRRKGHEPIGIRLDSGDLAYLTIQAARMLDEAGFPKTSIVWSNQLDELVLWQILSQISQEAPRYGMDPEAIIHRLSYGVGTRLITSAGDPALDGVYKLVAVREDGAWVPAIKLSDNPFKTLNPGYKNVWRIYDFRGKATADVIGLGDEVIDATRPLTIRHPSEPSTYRKFNPQDISAIEPLLVDVVKDGKTIIELPSLEEIRQKRQDDLERLDPGVKRLLNPHIYHVSLTENLWKMKQDLIAETIKAST
jgi:nicotinate phosphoribosyltransferase